MGGAVKLAIWDRLSTQPPINDLDTGASFANISEQAFDPFATVIGSNT